MKNSHHQKHILHLYGACHKLWSSSWSSSETSLLQQIHLLLNRCTLTGNTTAESWRGHEQKFTGSSESEASHALGRLTGPAEPQVPSQAAGLLSPTPGRCWACTPVPHTDAPQPLLPAPQPHALLLAPFSASSALRRAALTAGTRGHGAGCVFTEYP